MYKFYIIYNVEIQKHDDKNIEKQYKHEFIFTSLI